MSSNKLYIGIPSSREVTYLINILSNIDFSLCNVECIISRYKDNLFTENDLESINKYCKVIQLISNLKYPPSMRNVIIDYIEDGNILFLDDDIIPSKNILSECMNLIDKNNSLVYQGPPYLTYNNENWYARMEGKLYERGFKRYINDDNNVNILDSRILLIPRFALVDCLYNEELIFGGEGRELAERLIKKNIQLKFADNLIVRHNNRDSLTSIINQKRIHGNGRGQFIVNEKKEFASWLKYFYNDWYRHFINPFILLCKFKISFSEYIYIILTNLIFWIFAFETIIFNKTKRHI